jgi:hypothetical protein
VSKISKATTCFHFKWKPFIDFWQYINMIANTKEYKAPGISTPAMHTAKPYVPYTYGKQQKRQCRTASTLAEQNCSAGTTRYRVIALTSHNTPSSDI